ncbi:uncharacterized protein ACBR49_016626 [Aulostomus maculatus]
MPKTIKHQPAEAVRRTEPVKAANRGGCDLALPTARRSRASSCPRCPQRGCSSAAAGAQVAGRSRSRSSVPRGAVSGPKTNPGNRKATGSHSGVNRSPSVRAETKCPTQSHKAFTVIAPNPKRRQEIQRKAEEELAALEELRLSKAMAYISIDPSSVGGCMSLEEVRLRQQQEMMQSRRKHKQMKKHVMEQTSILNS